MKLCTDLKQSKRLAKFLPHESADLWWAERYAGRMENWEYIVEEKPVYYLSFTKPSENNYSQDTIKDIPSWSLVALFRMLPKSAYLEKGSSTELYRLTLPVELISSDWNLEPVDACYEMILKLNELKML